MTEDQVAGVSVVPITALVDEQLRSEDSLLEQEQIEKDLFKASLSGHIQHEFQVNKDARRASGAEARIQASLRAYNGEYDPADLARIADEGGSQIFMNLTATKAKVAKSWITDIYRSVNDDIFTIEHSPNPELPKEVTDAINESVETSIEGLSPGDGDNFNPVNPDGSPNTPASAPSMNEAQKSLSDINQEKRDLTELMVEEISKEAKFQMRIMERQIKDQLVEGNWENALNEFIEDFTVYPTAWMKGPIVTKKKKLIWKDGQPVVDYDYVFVNDRVNPIDMYPSPSAKSVQDGNNIEHVRYNRRTLSSLKINPSYKADAIVRVLENQGYAPWLDTGVESELASSELRGTEYDMNRDVFHGLHYFGSVPVQKLRQWGLDLYDHEDTDELEVEAILVGNEVIKCDLNKDPLLRRPYYAASFYNRPGSIYGRSLPEMMRDIQRMVNAAARALSNNLGISSGPMVGVYIDRLADDGEMEEPKPMKIFQLTSDPTGGSGKAIDFFQPQSNASELIGVYEKFEEKADDVTGIPKYAYGNQQTGGAATTVSGLSIILESATKVIKDAVRNIDIGLIKPRVEFQFYYNLLKNNKDLKFSGDIDVVPRGSSTLTVKAAQQMRRNEFLQITANPVDQKIMGVEGRADLLREVSKDLGLDSSPIPGRIELKRTLAEEEEAMAAAQQAEAEAKASGHQANLQATQIQIEGQKGMHESTQKFKMMELQAKVEQQNQDRQVSLAKLETVASGVERKSQVDLARTEMTNKSKEDMQTQEVALSMTTDDKVN